MNLQAQNPKQYSPSFWNFYMRTVYWQSHTAAEERVKIKLTVMLCRLLVFLLWHLSSLLTSSCLSLPCYIVCWCFFSFVFLSSLSTSACPLQIHMFREVKKGLTGWTVESVVKNTCYSYKGLMGESLLFCVNFIG